jgi:hypothetical protein
MKLMCLKTSATRVFHTFAMLYQRPDVDFARGDLVFLSKNVHKLQINYS